MKNPPVIHIAWACVVLIAFFSGYLSDGSRSVPIPEPQTTAAATPHAVGSPEKPARDEAEGAAIGAQELSAKDARAQAFSILSEPNRIVRMRKMMELLARVDKGNWREVMAAFNAQVTKEFRSNGPEWQMFLERVGEVSGAEALAEVTAADSTKPDVMAFSFMTGWASTDPQAALAWFQSQGPGQQGRFLRWMLDGISRTDPKLALSLAVAKDQSAQEETIPLIINNAIQLGGFVSAEALLSPLIGRADIEDGTRGKVFSQLASRRISAGITSRDRMDALNWYGNYLLPKSPAGPIAIRQIVGAAAAADSPATLAWLDERAQRLGKYHSELAYPTVAQVMAVSSPDQFAAWMGSHTDSPLYDKMAEAAANGLMRNGRLDKAKEWAGAIQDDELRKKGTTTVLDSEKNRAVLQNLQPAK